MACGAGRRLLTRGLREEKRRVRMRDVIDTSLVYTAFSRQMYPRCIFHVASYPTKIITEAKHHVCLMLHVELCK